MKKKLFNNFRVAAIAVVTLAICFSCSYLPEENIDTVINELEEAGDYILLYNNSRSIDRVLIFVPGGLVDPHAYLCWMDDLVETVPGLAIATVKIPSNLAILNPDKVKEVMNELEEPEHVMIGGHSLGGVVAASTIEENPGQYDGLILLGSWTTSYADLSKWDGRVLSIFGSEDGLSTPVEVQDNAGFLPEGVTLTTTDAEIDSTYQTQYFEIEGGNHAGFGCYGPQDGDKEATITVEEQHEIMIRVIRKFMDSVWQ